MSKKRGLTQKEADERLKEFGLNEIRDVSKTTPLKILLRQIKSNFIVYLLFAAVIISFAVGKTVTAYAILVVLGIIITVGFIQEFRSEKAISALKNMLVPISIVLRDGKEHEIKSSEIVPGDVLVLRNGEKIPADCVLLEQKELRVNEAVLTGESRDVKKKASSGKKYTDENLVFMGTYIVNGRCIAEVLHTGMNTKFGKIAKLISTTEKELPLQNKVNKITKYAVFLALLISFITGIILISRSQLIDKEFIINTLIFVIALSVASFPESLPLVLTTTLASGAYRMSKKNAIVNRMSIIETLGETTVICSDKTGTITKGEMTVRKIFAENTFFDVSGTGYEAKGDFFHKSKKINIKKKHFFMPLCNNAVLCNDSHIERTGENEEYRTIGSPTESALLILAAKAGIFSEDITSKRFEEIPFNSERKMMSVLCNVKKEKILYSKGAPEHILKNCRFILKGRRVQKLTEKEKKRILKANSKMTLESLRTLAFAYKKVKKISKKNFEKDLVFIGLVGMEDPPREEVKKSIKQCREAGIDVKMITGDNKETALSIAREIGLKGSLIEGAELENITDEELTNIIKTISIFARVNPEHKLRIVKALKNNGEIVTMTGDGVNDAPALKEAHIGVAMGKNGTDVSRSVSDLTLKDDNFSTIVSAIGEGRGIFNNIKKFTTYQLSCNFAEVTILFIGVLLSPLLGWQAPLLVAMQLLFMNMVTADLPAIALSFNPISKDIMQKKPRKKAQILGKRLLIVLILNGVLKMIFVLLSYFFSFNILGRSMEYSRTVALLTLIGLEIVSAFNFRSFRKGVLTRSLFVNMHLVYASLISILATAAIVYTPLKNVFETVPIGLKGYLMVLVFSFLLIVIFDVLKAVNNKKKFFSLESL